MSPAVKLAKDLVVGDEIAWRRESAEILTIRHQEVAGLSFVEMLLRTPDTRSEWAKVVLDWPVLMATRPDPPE